MKYKVGDKVRIKSLDWYYKHALIDTSGVFRTSIESLCLKNRRFLGKELTICSVLSNGHYLMEETGALRWTDEMIEGLVEEEITTKPKFKVGDEVIIKGTDIEGTVESIIRGQLIVNYKGSKMPAWPEDVVLMESVEEETKPNIIEEAKTYWDSIKDAWICPEGYQFKDEHGNVINATKIVLENKKKEYPKTYEECAKELGYNQVMPKDHILGYRGTLLSTFQQLLICRDAYWKIAGEEMGLGKPWEPDYLSDNYRYCIVSDFGKIIKNAYKNGENHILPFPTPEMRDAFYENFKGLINECKELL